MIEYYATVKTVHIATVAISGSLFALRGLWVIWKGALRARWAKILPHVNDTVLLASGITLAFTIKAYPFYAAWLTAKLVALVGYIALGLMTFRVAATRGTRTLFWVVSLAVFGYMVAVAITRSAWPIS